MGLKVLASHKETAKNMTICKKRTGKKEVATEDCESISQLFPLSSCVFGTIHSTCSIVWSAVGCGWMQHPLVNCGMREEVLHLSSFIFAFGLIQLVCFELLALFSEADV